MTDIIELAKRAGALHYSPPPMRAVRGVSMTFEQLEKFAALIAEECAKICEESLSFNYDSPGEGLAFAIRATFDIKGE